MSDARWQQIKALFQATVDRPPAERASFLAAATGSDEALRREIESLLASDSSEIGFTDRLPFRQMPPLPDVSESATSSDTTSAGAGLIVGPYRVIGLLGVGGMGEVFRARDSKLHRDVALKVLPSAFEFDPDRLARFRREAQVLASLNHPHIAAIYGLEESDGRQALVLELVEGETLANRIDGGPLPLADALRMARQIAEALQAAHDKGIIHRDLKPANIKVTPAGVVKVLDFGLAKTAAGDIPLTTMFASRGGAGETRVGTVLGTAAYMSPEQARGEPVDARSDVWAFGCVLFEMLAGRQVFPADVTSDSVAKILEQEPDWSGLPKSTPATIHQLLRHCLQKDRGRRLQTIAEARRVVEAVLAPRAMSRRTWLVIGAAAVLALSVGAGSLFLVWSREPLRTEISPVTRLTFDSGLTVDPALSPDGTLMAYASDRAGEGNLDIWLQQVAGGEPTRLTTNAADERTPAFSPDGTRIAFRSERDGGAIYVVPALGGEPTLLAANAFEPSFSPDGKWISFSTGLKAGDDGTGRTVLASANLFIIPAVGGQPHEIQPTAQTAVAAAWSPDSTHLLIQASFGTGAQTDDWWVTPLEGVATKVNREPLMRQQLRARPIAWLQGNRIVYAATSGDSRNHWSVTLSDRDWQITSPPERLTAGAGSEGRGSVATVAGAARLAFSTVTNVVDLWSVLLSRNGLQPAGAPVRLTQDTALDMHPALTPDGRTLIFSTDRRRQRALWVRDLATGREAPLVSLPGKALLRPVVSMDGSKLAFWQPEGDGQPAATLVVTLSRASDGSLQASEPRALPSAVKEGSGWPWSWSPTGDLLWYDPALWPKVEPNYLYDVAHGKLVFEFRHPTHDPFQLHFSPDGRWLAFQEPLDDGKARMLIAKLDAAGRPGPSADWIEIARGDSQAWSPMGGILYYDSDRDGSWCIWAQSLDRDTMRPIGPPIALHHAHSSRLSIGNVGQTVRGFAASRDRVVFNMSEMSSNIWMTELPAR